MVTRNLKNTKQMCVICKNKQEYILFDEIDFSYHSSVHFHNQNFFCFLKDNTYLYGKLGVKKKSSQGLAINKQGIAFEFIASDWEKTNI